MATKTTSVPDYYGNQWMVNQPYNSYGSVKNPTYQQQMSRGTPLGTAPAAQPGAQAGASTITASSNTRQAQSDAALARLGQVGSGENKPVGPAERANQVSTQSDMSAAAEAQQQQALARTTAAGGGSLYDPSHGAAERELTANRQERNQRSVNAIDTNAAQQNFDAQFAANRLLMWDGSPYATSSRYGSGTSGGAGQSYIDQYDPRRGGNIQGSGLGFNPDNLTGGAQHNTQPATQPATQPSGYVSSTKDQSVEQILQQQLDDKNANIQFEAGQLGQYGYSKYQQALGWGYSPESALDFARRNA